MKKLLVLLVLVGSVAFGQLSGPYTIGVGGSYTTIAAAITDLNTNGVSGAVVFSLIDAAYSETGANLVINVTTNAPTVTNTITFKPASSIQPNITISGCVSTAGASQYSGFSVNGTSYITIDGSNNGTSSQDLTFTMNDGTNGRNVIQLYGNCDNVTIKNINISYQSPMVTANSSRGIYLNGQSTGACDNFTVQNCNIGDATNTPYYATGITGSSGSLIYCTNITIKDNNLYGRIRPVYFFYVGVTSTTSEISNNNIYTYGGLNATTTYFSIFNTWGGTVNIFNNRMPVMTTNNTVTSGVFGISNLSAQSGAVCNIYNNFIGGNLSFTGTGVPSVIALMYLQDNGTYNVYHNTFSFPSVSNSTERSCIHISGTSAVVNLQNNILVNSTDATNAYCIWKSNGTLTSDWNNLYVSGASANVGFVAAAAKQTLANWQSSGFDANSKSGAVVFTSATDLHLDVTALPNYNLVGTPQSSPYDFDIDNDLRDATYPYIGADESAVLLPVELTSFTAVARGKNVELKWATATEHNNLGFDIEKSVNGVWSKIGFVSGAGNSNAPKEYGYVDAVNENATYSYRLKQIDQDGKFTYNNAIEVHVNAAVNSYQLAQNFPNPFNPATTIRFSVPQMENASVKVYDVTGREVVTLFNGVAAPGQVYNVQFNGAGLASGIYFYVLQTQSYRDVKKMSLLK